MESSRHSFGGISGRWLLEKRTIFVCIRLLVSFGRQNGSFFALRVGVRRYGGCGVIGADLSFFFIKICKNLYMSEKKCNFARRN